MKQAKIMRCGVSERDAAGLAVFLNEGWEIAGVGNSGSLIVVVLTKETKDAGQITRRPHRPAAPTEGE